MSSPREADELWRFVLAYLHEHPVLAGEPWGRDRPRIDELLAELYLLGERPSPSVMRGALAKIGASPGWSKEVTRRWSKRLKQPAWRPRELARTGNGWVEPFYVPDAVATEHGLRSVRDRLAVALAAAAADFMRRSEDDPASAGLGDEAAVFELTAGAVRLWSLSQDAVDGVGWPSVLSCRLTRSDNLMRHLTNQGRVREREQLDRWAAERLEGDRDHRNNLT